MEGSQITRGRKKRGLTQQQLAVKLGCSQAYLSLMENGRRAVPAVMRQKLVRTLLLPATHLPVGPGVTRRANPGDWLRRRLGELGYPGFRYLSRGRRPSVHPAEVLLCALAEPCVDQRVLEALPWLLLEFGELDRDSLVDRARSLNVQNRLGFVASLARAIAESEARHRDRVRELAALLETLEPYRLARSDDLGQAFKSEAFSAYVEANRSAAATHWNLLTTLEPLDVSHVS